MADCPGIFQLAQMRDGALARIRVPGGELSVEQLRTVARLAEDLGNGQIDLTNRANLQVRGLDARHAADLVRGLADVGLACPNTARERIRNITASPMAGLDPGETHDVRPLVDALDRALQASEDLDQLSPKFSFVLDGGGAMDLGAIGYDVGFFAMSGPTEPMFEVGLAGRLRLGRCVRPGRVVDVALAVAEMARQTHSANGGRVTDLLVWRSPDEIIEALERRIGAAVFEEPRDYQMQQPLPAQSYLGPHWQKQPGVVAYGLGVVMARMSTGDAREVARWAEDLGDGTLRLTPWQAIILPGVAMKHLDQLRQNAQAAGFLTEPHEGLVKVVGCAGAIGCERTCQDTKADGRELVGALKGSALPRDEPMTIHLSGCERGCAHPGVADLLFLARSDGSGYDAYAKSAPKCADGARRLGRAANVAELTRIVVDKHRSA